MPENTPIKDLEVTATEQGSLIASEITETPSGTGKTNFIHTVPTGKKWTIKSYSNQGSSFTGASNNFELEVRLGGAGNYHSIIAPDSNGITAAGHINNDIQLAATDQIRVRINLTSYTSGDIISKLLIHEADS